MVSVLVTRTVGVPLLLLLVGVCTTVTRALAPPVVVVAAGPSSAAYNAATFRSVISTSWISSATSNSLLLLSSSNEPSASDIQLLRNAFAEFGGRNYQAALDLFNQVIDIWKGQPKDEQAGLYRVRGDIYFRLNNAAAAYSDYSTTIDLLLASDGAADPNELPIALLGRARALKSMATTTADFEKAAKDYQQSLTLSGNDEYDDDQTLDETIATAASRNPYAAWEWGDCYRSATRYQQAYDAHTLAADSFANIGDTARSLMARIDAGIDSSNVELLQQAIVDIGKGVESRDVALLQRVLVSENEARMAVAALLWSSNQRGAAERELGNACLRMEQNPAKAVPNVELPFTIDDDARGLVGNMYCSKFKNKDFVSKLQWPEDLQRKVLQLSNLK